MSEVTADVARPDPVRRSLLGGMAAAAVLPAAPLAAQAAGAGLPGAAGAEELMLWPGTPPGLPSPPPVFRVTDRPGGPVSPNRSVAGIARPVLSVRRAARPDGSAVMLIPGGGYAYVSWDNEGEEQARWLNARGTTCFILTYRLPGEGWADRSLAPLADAQRGMRLIRAHAARYGVDPARVAVLGFSAGGHLGGSLATRFAERAYAPADAADRLSARPDLAGLVYPVVNLSQPFTHAGSRDNLLGRDADRAALERASVERRVTADTPPLFLVHAADDGTVPVDNSLVLYAAARAAKVPVEMHLFERGGHGFGTRLKPDQPAAAWPTLFAAYARSRGVMRG